MPQRHDTRQRPDWKIIPGGIKEKITPYERMMAKVKRCAMAGDYDTAHKIITKFARGGR